MLGEGGNEATEQTERRTSWAPGQPFLATSGLWPRASPCPAHPGPLTSPAWLCSQPGHSLRASGNRQQGGPEWRQPPGLGEELAIRELEEFHNYTPAPSVRSQAPASWGKGRGAGGWEATGSSWRLSAPEDLGEATGGTWAQG